MEWFTELPWQMRVVLGMATLTMISIFVRKTTGVNLGLGADQGNKSKKCSSCLSVIPFDASKCKRCGTSQFAQSGAVKVNPISGRVETIVEPKEKTCPACISEVPFIATKCRFCGTDLEVPPIDANDETQSAWGRPSESDEEKP